MNSNFESADYRTITNRPRSFIVNTNPPLELSITQFNEFNVSKNIVTYNLTNILTKNAASSTPPSRENIEDSCRKIALTLWESF